MLCLRYLQSLKRWFTYYNIERRKETYMNKKEVLEIRKQFSLKTVRLRKSVAAMWIMRRIKDGVKRRISRTSGGRSI